MEVAWAAGVLEGEGCFSMFRRNDRPNTINCSVFLEMTDEDIVRRVQEIFGVGTINSRVRKDTIRKPSWCWAVQNKRDVRIVLEQVLPYLGIRRSAKAKELLEVCK